MTDLFVQTRNKMLKINECFTSLAENHDFAARLPNVKLELEGSRGNRLGQLYKYLVAMFNEWAVNLKQNELAFETLLASVNKHSLLVFSGIHDVIENKGSF